MMHARLSKNRKGFTLIEVLLITVLLAILGLAALSSFTDSSSTFTFLQKYKNIISSIRGTRVLALTNKTAGAERYGILFEQTVGAESGENIIKATAFADNGSIVFALDEDDELMPSDSYTIEGKFDLKVGNAKTGNGLPILIFYNAGAKKMEVISDSKTLESELEPIVSLQFSDTEKGHEKYIGIFQVTGLIEEFNQSPL